jgi:FkbM family methyltransferase
LNAGPAAATERLAAAVRYRRSGWLRRLASHPLREAVAAAHRSAHRLPPRETSVRLFTGQTMRVLLPETVALDLYRHRCIEPDLTSLLLDELRPGMVFVDVGAHYGYYSLLAQPLVGDTGHVFAFEPGRSTISLLRRNLAGLPNVRVEQAAVCDRTGRHTMHDFGPRHSALGGLFAQARTPAEERAGLRAETYEVVCVALDDYFGQLGVRPDVVKVDAESSEFEVLQGMERILREGAPLVTIEVGDYEVSGSRSSRDCISLLESLGYAAFERADGRVVPHRPRGRYEYGNLHFRKRRAG